jgi:arylsulfatase A-like enzyme
MPEQHEDGVSLVPLLKGKKIDERALVWHYPHYGNQGGEPSSIIRKGNWKLIHYFEDDHEELYNLKKDPSETTDVIAKNSELASQLSKELFDYLHKVGARFPAKDPDYNADMEKEYLNKMKTVVWPNVENERKQFLRIDFDPKNDWWGSRVTKD